MSNCKFVVETHCTHTQVLCRRGARAQGQHAVVAIVLQVHTASFWPRTRGRRENQFIACNTRIRGRTDPLDRGASFSFRRFFVFLIVRAQGVRTGFHGNAVADCIHCAYLWGVGHHRRQKTGFRVCPVAAAERKGRAVAIRTGLTRVVIIVPLLFSPPCFGLAARVCMCVSLRMCCLFSFYTHTHTRRPDIVLK